MFFNFFLKNSFLAILFHILLGILAKFVPVIEAIYYVGIAVFGFWDILQSKSTSNNKPAFYLLYITGFEIVYRVGKYYFLWELGKYLCILIAIAGLIKQSKLISRASPFVIYLILLIPGILVSIWYGHSDVNYLRKIMLQHISGPLTLGIVSIYFYKKLIPFNELFQLLRIAILPSISLTTLLFLGSRISEVEFISSSNFAVSGGFGPNQVSTMLGWGILLLIFGLISNKPLTYNRVFDIALLCLLAFRGLLTLSRGGMLAAVAASLFGFLIALIYSSPYRNRIGKLSIRLIAGFVSVMVMAYFVNLATNNFLLYRYQGKSTTEALTGRVIEQKRLSGRSDLMEMELDAFVNYPFFGLGVGQGTLYRQKKFSEKNPSHTEQSRLLGEHGVLGIIILIFILIVLPISFFFKLKYGLNKHWSAQFFLMATLTMFHSGMRLSMPAIAFAIIFLIIIPNGFDQKSNSVKKTLIIV